MSDTKTAFDSIPLGGSAGPMPMPAFSRSTVDAPPAGGLLPPTRKPVAVSVPEPSAAPDLTPPPIGNTPPPNAGSLRGFLWDLVRPTRGKMAILAGGVSLVAGAYGLNLIVPGAPTPTRMTNKEKAEVARLTATGGVPSVEVERMPPQVDVLRNSGTIRTAWTEPAPMPPVPVPSEPLAIPLPNPTPLPLGDSSKPLPIPSIPNDPLPAPKLIDVAPLPKPGPIEVTPLPKPPPPSVDAAPLPVPTLPTGGDPFPLPKPTLPIVDAVPPPKPTLAEPDPLRPKPPPVFVEATPDPKPVPMPKPTFVEPDPLRPKPTPAFTDMTPVSDLPPIGGTLAKPKVDPAPVFITPDPTPLLPPPKNLNIDPKPAELVAPAPPLPKPSPFLDTTPPTTKEPLFKETPPTLVPVVPAGTGLKEAPPAATMSGVTAKRGVEVDVVKVRGNDTYATISDSYYQSKKYAAALKAFNGNAEIATLGEVEVPPLHELNKPPVREPADAKPMVRGPVTDSQDDSVEWGPAGKRRPMVELRKFSVVRDGSTPREVAKFLYGDESEWPKLIAPRGQRLRADDQLPRGTELTYPWVDHWR